MTGRFPTITSQFILPKPVYYSSLPMCPVHVSVSHYDQSKFTSLQRCVLHHLCSSSLIIFHLLNCVYFLPFCVLISRSSILLLTMVLEWVTSPLNTEDKTQSSGMVGLGSVWLGVLCLWKPECKKRWIRTKEKSQFGSRLKEALLTRH